MSTKTFCDHCGLPVLEHENFKIEISMHKKFHLNTSGSHIMTFDACPPCRGKFEVFVDAFRTHSED